MEYWNSGLNKKFLDSLALFQHIGIPLCENDPLMDFDIWNL
jgi:hypothetical protein